MGDACIREKLHLFFCGPHEKEAGCVEELRGRCLLARDLLVFVLKNGQSLATYEGWEVLEAVRFADASAVFQDEGDFDDPRRTSGHQGIAKDGMHHGREW